MSALLQPNTGIRCSNGEIGSQIAHEHQGRRQNQYTQDEKGVSGKKCTPSQPTHPGPTGYDLDQKSTIEQPPY
jgi:hypothetical protein